MQIKRIEVDKNNPSTEGEPMIRFSLLGEGCSSEGCHCSPDYYLCISDGKTWLTATLTEEEAKLIRQGHTNDVFVIPKRDCPRCGERANEGDVCCEGCGEELRGERAAAIKKESHGAFDIETGVVYYKGQPVHNLVAERIIQFSDHDLPFEPLLPFLENLLQNPSKRVVEELYSFLERRNLPVMSDGCFQVTYKTIRSDESGTSGHRVGDVVEVPRRTFGPHLRVEASEIRSFSEPIDGIVVKVNPRDVISVPHDQDATELQVCRFEVITDSTVSLVDAIDKSSAQQT